ncbi:MAG: metalloregulator ArsR/SmtB family transcription factor [Pseudomonadales bacterium]
MPRLRLKRPESLLCPMPLPAASSAEPTAARASAQEQVIDADALALLARRHRALGDELRLTLLRVLRQSSYGVSELAEIVDMTQPALSHHLKLLHEAELVARRREGNSIYYRRNTLPNQHALAPLYKELDVLPLDAPLQQRRDQVLARRRAQSQRFFDEHATAFREQQARISATDVYCGVVIDLVDRLCSEHSSAIEVGPGDGELLSALARRFEQVIAIDHSERMLAQTANAVRDSSNVTLRQQAFETLEDHADQDLVLAAMVLHHLPDPSAFFTQASRVLKPHGLLMVAELCSHDQQWAHSACGDLWLGFEAADLQHWATSSGFSVETSEYLAQRNGFRIQIHGFRCSATPAHSPHY